MKRLFIVVCFLIPALSFATLSGQQRDAEIASVDDASITLLSPVGGEIWQAGARPDIMWKSLGVQTVRIEFSADHGANWNTLLITEAARHRFSWSVPAFISDDCLMRVSDNDNVDIFDQSAATFRIIENDGSQIKIVVLGSSTAAGVGPSSSDSAWVNRYRKHLYQLNTTSNVVNLAVGGYTTYHLMPDDFQPPGNRPAPSVGHNITTALLLDADVIIINLPSNDAARNYSVAEQLANYDSVLAKAGEKNVPVWITTTQPRNLSSSQRQNLMAMRDSTFSRFGEKAIDFWNGLANEDGTIKPEFNSGDNIHLNDKAHRILEQRVIEKDVLSKLLDAAFIDSRSENFPVDFKLQQNFPNPFNSQTTITVLVPSQENISLSVYDIWGRRVDVIYSGVLSPGAHEFQWPAPDIASGIYFYRLSTKSFISVKRMTLLR